MWAFLFVAMRSFIIFCYIILCCPNANAQIGFSRYFDFDQAGLAFASLEYNGNHTVSIYGNLIDADLKHGLLFASFDTLGNLLDYKVEYDSLNDVFTLAYPNSLIKLSDGSGFAGVGSFFYSKNGYMVIYDNDGTIRRFAEYEDLGTRVDFYIEIIEVPDGFFILGDKQKNNYHTDIFLMKTDKAGNKLWEKRYGHPTRKNYYGSIVKVNDNEYVIGGLTTLTPMQGQIVKNTSNFYVIDSLGNLKSSWQSPESLNDIGVGFGLYKTEQNGWVYATVEGQVQPDGFFERKWSFIERDSAYNLVAQKSYGGFHNLNWMVNFKQLANGDYLIIGSNVVSFEPPAQYIGLHMGSLLRVSPSGDSIWNYADTAFAAALNVLYDVVELPSGSIIACGYSRTNDSPKDWGWLIKINNDGCVDTLNCFPMSSVGDFMKEQQIKVYPNPTTDFIYLDLPEGEQLEYQIIDLSGNLMKSGIVSDSKISTSLLSSGGYMLKLRSKNAITVKKIIKI